MNYYRPKISWLVVIFGVLASVSCEKTPTDYRSYLDDEEHTYPAAPFAAEALPGNYRLLFQWKRSADPSISRYVLYWNESADSVVMPYENGPSDTVELLVEPLEEDVFNFLLYAYDKQGSRSIPVRIENVRTYGDDYEAFLLNRGVSAADYVNDSLKIDWVQPDTINITTEVRYTDSLDQARSLALHPDSSRLTILDWKEESEIYYRSSYIPQRNAIDTFTVVNYDTLRVELE